MLKCHWKSTLGVECPGCGFQRSIDLLFQGDVMGSIEMYPASIPLLFTLLFTCIHLFLKLKSGPKIIVASFSITAVLVVANFVAKAVESF